jgi:hypothetical protein
MAADDGSMWIADLVFEHGPFYTYDDESDGIRIITIITAKHPDGSVFWSTPFYKSTGMNSKFPGLWFPFAGFSNKQRPGKSTIEGYLSKELGVPSAWPDSDMLVFVTDKIPPERAQDLVKRIMTRSFLLASNFMEAFGDSERNKALNMRNLFPPFIPIIQPKQIDVEIKRRLNDNKTYNTYDETFISTIPESFSSLSALELNKIIGPHVYFNPYIDPKLNLSMYVDALPNYNTNVKRFAKKLMGGGTRRKHRSRQTRTRKGRRGH